MEILIEIFLRFIDISGDLIGLFKKNYKKY